MDRRDFEFRFRSGPPIDWDAHLPADDETGWLTVDLARRHLLLNPASALRLP